MCCRPSEGPILAAAIHGAVMIGQSRTLEQDIEFAFAQLSEIAIRALSPAINDTYTGLSCIDWLGDALRMLVALPNPDGVWRARRGRPRLLVQPMRIAGIVQAAFDLIREAGAGSPAVIVRLLQTYARLAPQLRNDEQRKAILEEVEAAREPLRAFLRSPWIRRHSIRPIVWLAIGSPPTEGQSAAAWFRIAVAPRSRRVRVDRDGPPDFRRTSYRAGVFATSPHAAQGFYDGLQMTLRSQSCCSGGGPARRNSQWAIKATADEAAAISAQLNTIESPNVPGGGMPGWIFLNAGSPKINDTAIGI